LLALAVLSAVALAASIAGVWRQPDGGWDAWAIWNLRARALYRSGGDLHLAYRAIIARPDYPPLLPGIVARTWVFIGREMYAAPAIIAGVFGTMCVVVLFSAVRFLRFTSSAALAAIVLLGTPEFLRCAESQMADVPIALFFLLSCAFVVIAIELADLRSLVLAGVCASLAAWTKNEGLLMAVCLAAALFLAGGCQMQDRLRAAACFLVGAAPLLLLLAWFRLRHAGGNDLLANTSSVAAAWHRLVDPHRYAAVLAGLARQLIRVDRWGVFLMAVPVIWICCCAGLDRDSSPEESRASRPCHDRAGHLLAMAIILVLLGYGLVYILTPYDLAWHISSSIDRLLLQCWPSAILATALGFPRAQDNPECLFGAGWGILRSRA
jgi:hypothetical protein